MSKMQAATVDSFNPTSLPANAYSQAITIRLDSAIESLREMQSALRTLKSSNRTNSPRPFTSVFSTLEPLLVGVDEDGKANN